RVDRVEHIQSGAISSESTLELQSIVILVGQSRSRQDLRDSKAFSASQVPRVQVCSLLQIPVLNHPVCPGVHTPDRGNSGFRGKKDQKQSLGLKNLLRSGSVCAETPPLPFRAKLQRCAGRVAEHD